MLKKTITAIISLIGLQCVRYHANALCNLSYLFLIVSSPHRYHQELQIRGALTGRKVSNFSVIQLRPTLCNSRDCSTAGFPVLHHLLELAQTHVHWVGDAIQPSHPLSSLLLLPSIFPSIRVFSNESVVCIRWTKDWSFSFSISPSNECSGLTSFRMDWLDLLAVQRTLKSLRQHQCSKASIFWHSVFFIAQLLHP